MKILLNIANAKEKITIKHIVLINKVTNEKSILAFKNNSSVYSKRYNDCNIELNELDVEKSILPSKELIKIFNDNDKANRYCKDSYIDSIVFNEGYSDELTITYLHIQVNDIFTANVLYKDKVKMVNTSVPVASCCTDNEMFIICSDDSVFRNKEVYIPEPLEPRVIKKQKKRKSFLKTLCSKVKDVATNIAYTIKNNVNSSYDDYSYSNDLVFLSRLALINR